MMEWIAQAIAKSALGYAVRRYRSRPKVSLETHIEQSLSDRTIDISITNHGNTPIIVDSWTVHIPLEELLPGVAGVVDKPESRPPKRFGRIRGVTKRISRLLYKGSPLASMNEISRLLAQSALGEPHGRHQLLDPGARQRIEAGESVVRRFPRTGSLRQTWKIVSNTQQLTIIPSCHIVGRRGRLWGLPSYLIGGPVPISAQITPPRTDDQD